MSTFVLVAGLTFLFVFGAALLPAGVTELTAVADGLAARWDERGAEHEVERLAAALVTLREACLGGGNRSSPAQGRT